MQESASAHSAESHVERVAIASENDKAPKETRNSFVQVTSEPYEENSNDSLMRLTATIFSYLTVLILGGLLCWFFFPRIEVIGVPLDPFTGKPIPGYTLVPQQGSSPSDLQPDNQNRDPNQTAPPANSSKENHGGSK